MNSLLKYRLLYYIATAITALPVIIAILSILNWPVIAETALGVALFLHSLILAKYAKNALRHATESGLLQEWAYSLSQEVEVSEQNRKH